VSSSSKASFISGAFRGAVVRHGIRAALVLAAAGVTLLPERADSAGVYENAAAESAFLFAPQRIALRASLEVSRGDSLDATIYRFYAAFPVRTAFLVAVEEPLVSASDNAGIDSGLGDLVVRLRARLFGRTRCLWAVGSLGAGTGERRLFPYSSESVDIAASFAYTDSVGVLDVFLSAGLVWAQRIPEELAGLHDDYARFSAGAGLRAGNAEIRAGLIAQQYSRLDAHREMAFAGAGLRWTESLRFFLEGQVETGPVGDRASDWAATAGVAVHF
jgi:hypothetical protein